MADDSGRVVVWDPQLDWIRRGYASVATLRELATTLRDSLESSARIAFRGIAGDRELFASFCRIAGAWAKFEPATIIVEELSWVTTTSKAPAGWHELVTGGLKYGLNLVSITQRPQEADKTALSQADIVRCFMLERAADQKYMAAELGVDVAKIAALEPLQFVEKDRRRRAVRTGAITF